MVETLEGRVAGKVWCRVAGSKNNGRRGAKIMDIQEKSGYFNIMWLAEDREGQRANKNVDKIKNILVLLFTDEFKRAYLEFFTLR